MENSEENQQEENLRNLNMVENEKDAEECKLMCVSYIQYKFFFL